MSTKNEKLDKKPSTNWGEAFQNAVNVGQIQLDDALIKIREITKSGQQYYDIRKFIQNKTDYIPTKAGLFLPSETWYQLALKIMQLIADK
jgi:hypothetical protein